MPADRAKRNKEIRRDALREELKSREYVRQVSKILEKNYMEIDPQFGKEDSNEEKAAKIAAIAGGRDVAIREANMKLGGYFKLLAKTLPDLSAVHTTDDSGKSFEDWLNDLTSETSDN